MDARKSRVQAFFGRHAEDYRTSSSHRTGEDLDILKDALSPGPDDTLLDVATATGHTAFFLLPHVRSVTGVDLTPEMEGAFMKEMAERGLAGARFVVGDVEDLPFSDGSFSIVTCRRAAHHFPRRQRAIDSMARVLMPGGRLGLTDMLGPDVSGGPDLFDRLERLRDGSHVHAWTKEECIASLSAAGLVVTFRETLVEDIPWEQWLKPVARTAELDRLMRDAALAAPEEARRELVIGSGETLAFRKRRLILVAKKPS